MFSFEQIYNNKRARRSAVASVRAYGQAVRSSVSCRRRRRRRGLFASHQARRVRPACTNTHTHTWCVLYTRAFMPHRRVCAVVVAVGRRGECKMKIMAKRCTNLPHVNANPTRTIQLLCVCANTHARAHAYLVQKPFCTLKRTAQAQCVPGAETHAPQRL